ncbi:MAG TPA: type VI secretion system-associated FHA domain protein TagH [Burkholderiaceae bacterium]|nr:type VI secretion system-associated FHA domain protein TagH [Burkholderiaceae bacterium]
MIWIRIVSKDGAPASALSLGVPLAARFGESTGDLGRGVGCTLVLPDPDRAISRKQALISSQGGRHFIRPIGTNLDIRLNGRQLPADVESPLDVGAEIRIGPYVMRVERTLNEGAAKAMPAGAPAPAVPQRAGDPLAILGGGNRPARGGVFDDLLKASIIQPNAVGAPQQAPAPGRAPAQPPEKPRAPIAAPRLAPAAPSAKGDAAPVRAPTPAPAVPDKVRKDAAPERPAAEDEMVKALYGGLGVAVPPAAERSPQRLQLIGELLREALTGTLALLAARTIAKRELGAGATMLQTRGNNPLKFSPNVDAALTHLLGPPLRGFIGPRDALHDAFGDLRAHQVAVLAGMRAALEAVLERFDPVALEARLAPKGMWDHLLPVNRRAKLWEQFGEQYAEILREVEDDFDSLFGKAFLQAYEAQLAELARASAVDDDSQA